MTIDNGKFARRTKMIAAALALLLAGAATPAIAQTAPSPAQAAAAPLDPERLAIAEEIVALAFPVEQRQAMFSKAGETMMVQMRTALAASQGPALDAGADAIVDRYLDRVRDQNARMIAESSPPIFVAIARAYARAFTRDELLQIRAFVATPTGTKYLQRSSEMLSDPDVAQANTAYFQRVMTDLQPLQGQLMTELTAYFKKHPPKKRQ